MPRYKESMFNRVVHDGSKMIIFNSLTGPAGIRYVSESAQKKLDDWEKDNFESIDYDSTVFKDFLKCGFLVPTPCDEKELRDYYITKYMTSPRLHLVVHTTRNCNFRCTYCYMNHKNERISKDAQDGIINYIRKNIHRYMSVHISWFGGEPLMEMGAIEYISKEVIDICSKASRPYTSSVTTNGYYLTPKNIETLLKCKVRNFHLTIDGTKETHDKQRVLIDGSPTFDRIIENLLYIKNDVPTRALAVSIRTNMTKQHESTLSSYYDFYNCLFGDDGRFSLQVKPVADYGGDRVKAIENDLLPNMCCIYDSLSKLNGKIKFYWNMQDLSIGSSVCPSRMHNKYTIGCDGSVHKCDEDVGEIGEKPIGHLYSDGTMKLDEVACAKWCYVRHREQCDNCFFSMNCFMEGCPKVRVYRNENVCDIDFEEVDSLIAWAAKELNVETI